MTFPDKYEKLYASLYDHPQIQADILKKCFDYLHLADLNGDYLEFGVWKGDTFCIAYHFAQMPNNKYAQTNRLKNMQFYAFDSFKGLPRLSNEDRKGFQQGDFTEGNYLRSKENFVDNLRYECVDLDRVHIIEGWFKDTLKSDSDKLKRLKRVAVAWIDCDLYSSTILVLDFLTKYLVSGSIIIFDDWYTYRGSPDKGERRAFREWLKKNPQISISQFQKFGWHGNSFIIHKK